MAVLGLGAWLGLGVTGCSTAHQVRTAHTAHHRTDRTLRALAADYLAVAGPANHRLDVAVDAYADDAHHDLAAAQAALRAQAATERQFDRQLATIPFPPATAVTARALIRVNEIRAALAERQASARSIPALLAFTAEHKDADSQVEAQVRVLRAQLGLPPPDDS
jgi:DUF1365 family protein